MGNNKITMEPAVKGYFHADLFMKELTDSVESIGGIQEQYGNETLVDLIYLQWAIMTNSRIDKAPGSHVMDIVRTLPSGEKWAEFVNDADRPREKLPAQPDETGKVPKPAAPSM